MKTYTVQTFYFNELSPDAQRRAWERDREIIQDGGYNAEFRATLAAFEKIFDIYSSYSIDSCHYNFDFRIDEYSHADEIADPLRLAAFVWNNYAPQIKKGKYYSITRVKGNQYTTKHRHSRVTFEMDNCPLTGVFCDSDILAPVLDCLTYKRAFDTFDDLITDCLNNFFETWRDALEYAESLEFYAEEAEANEWEYLSDGTKWRGDRA